MKGSTKQRIFWIVVAFIIAGAILVLSSQNAGTSKGIGASSAEILQMGQQEEGIQVSNQETVLGSALSKAAHAFLYALLGFALYFVFEGFRARLALAIGSACLYGVLNGIYQTISGRYGRWRGSLIDLGGVLIGVGLAVLIVFALKKLKQWFDRRKEHDRLEMALDTLSLASVLFYAIYRFLQSTMFQFYYSNRYKMLTIILLIVFGGIRFLYLVLKKCWTAESHKEQSIFLLRCLLAFCLAIPFVLVGWMHDYKLLIYLPLCCMCLYNMVPEKVCKVFFVTIGTCLAAVILCCLSGTVRNIVHTQENFVGSYGIINTTDFASYFTFLLLTAWCSIKDRRGYASLLFAAIATAVVYGVYRVTGSRTSLWIGGLIVFFVLWDCLEENVLRRIKWLRNFGKSMNWLSVLAFPLVGALVIYVTARYSANDEWAVKLNAALSNRLETVLSPFLMYGIKPLGSSIVMFGNGGTALGSFWSTDYNYLDVGYSMLAIRYGWIITAIVMGLWIWMTARALKSGKNRFAFALAVMAAHAFSEARILDVNYNILLIMPLCAFVSGQNCAKKAVLKNKRLLPSLVVGFVLAGAVYCILPKALSWLRTFFYLKNWNSGTSAFASFIFCVWVVILIIALWKTVSLVWANRNKKSLIPFAGVIIFLMASVLSVNATIEYGRKNQADRLKAEEQIIQLIQESAGMPIYSVEPEELYKRDGIALSDHIFTSEELPRNKGSLIVDKSVEALEIIGTGCLYTQISDETGLYTYDPSVINVLSGAGYQWNIFYSGERHCNLQDVALFNDMKPDDHLVLSNSQRIATQNMETDQLSGTYQVHFTLSDFSSVRNEEAVLLEVLGENGDQVLFQQVLTNDDFDLDGQCEYTLTYRINATPKVSYAVSVMDGVTVTVNDISWQRIRVAGQGEHLNLLFAPENPQINFDANYSNYENGIWRFASGGNGQREIVDIIESPIEGVNRGLHITGNRDCGSFTDLAMDQIPLLYGHSYQLSCYAKGSGQLHLQHGKTSWLFTVHDLSDEWTYYTYYFTVGDGDGATPDSSFINVYLGCMVRTDSDIYICGMDLEEINPSVYPSATAVPLYSPSSFGHTPPFSGSLQAIPPSTFR